MFENQEYIKSNKSFLLKKNPDYEHIADLLHKNKVSSVP